MDMLKGDVVAVVGNHDCSGSGRSLCDDDTLSILCAADKIRLLDVNGRRGEPWVGCMNGSMVVIGGTHWGQEIPENYDRNSIKTVGQSCFVFWIVHDDIRFPGWEQLGKFDCREIPGVDGVINGHIHKELMSVKDGMTTWINPGNIARVERSEDCRQHIPAVLRIDIFSDDWKYQRVPVECHEPFDDVFYPRLDDHEKPLDESVFVKGLEELQRVKTTGGEGLQEFLAKNLDQFSDPVAKEIRCLAKEVLVNDEDTNERNAEI